MEEIEEGVGMIIQLEEHYLDREARHYMLTGIHPDLKPWHPHWTTLKLHWSMSGKWVSAPIYQDTQGDEPRIYRIARIEKYIDRRGQIKEATAYG